MNSVPSSTVIDFGTGPRTTPLVEQCRCFPDSLRIKHGSSRFALAGSLADNLVRLAYAVTNQKQTTTLRHAEIGLT